MQDRAKAARALQWRFFIRRSYGPGPRPSIPRATLRVRNRMVTASPPCTHWSHGHLVTWARK